MSAAPLNYRFPSSELLTTCFIRDSIDTNRIIGILHPNLALSCQYGFRRSAVHALRQHAASMGASRECSIPSQKSSMGLPREETFRVCHRSRIYVSEARAGAARGRGRWLNMRKELIERHDQIDILCTRNSQSVRSEMSSVSSNHSFGKAYVDISISLP